MPAATKSPPELSPRPASPGLAREVAVAGLAGAAGAALLLVPGLGTEGLWSDAELPVLDRARAALGEPLSDLVRSPWLPDELRTRAYGLVGGELGLRLPGAVAGCGLVGLTAAIGRAVGGSRRFALLAALFALAFPGLAMSARTALGNPVGELMSVLAVACGLLALGPLSLATRIAGSLLGAAFLALSVLASGILVGGVLPLVALAVSPRAMSSRPVAAGLWAAAVAGGGATAWLIAGQGEGYIPLLGAAKDLDLVASPNERDLVEGLEELAFFVFPWLPLAVVGALAPGRGRWPGAWLGAGAALLAAWSSVYGRTPPPLCVPTALCCAAGLCHLLDERAGRASRRLGLLVACVGFLTLTKDAAREPHRAGSPLHYFPGGLGYPAARIGTDDSLPGRARLALWGLLAAFWLAPRSPRPSGRPATRMERWGDALPVGLRRAAPLSVAGALLAGQALHFGRVVVDRTSAQLSARGPLARHSAWVAAGLLPASLGVHRARDRGLAEYGPAPGDVVQLPSRSDLTTWLEGDAPAVALIRRSELAPMHARCRQDARPFHVLDDAHHDLVLVANFLPDDLPDQNPFPPIVRDEPPTLAHTTLLRFERYVEVIGWEIEAPVVRGMRATLRLALRPLRSLPAGTQIIARLQRGKMSRINALPHELTGGAYPPSNWRAGDYILHEFEFEVPLLEILSGSHELIVGLRKGESKNFAISIPEGEEGEHGVLVKGEKREFAVVGAVDVY